MLSLKYHFGAVMLLLLFGCGGEHLNKNTEKVSEKAPQRATTPTSPADYQDIVQRIYVAYFGRPADPGGLDFFEQQFFNAGGPTNLAGLNWAYYNNPKVKELIEIFGNSPESKELYPGTTDEFVTAIYRNLLNRAPDPGGKAFWTAQINNGGLTRANAAIAMMGSAQSTDIDVIANKAIVATRFTNSLNTYAKRQSYAGQPANSAVRNMLNSVSYTTDPTTFQATVDSAINTLVMAKSYPPVAPAQYYLSNYICDSYGSNKTCDDSPYPFRWTQSIGKLNEFFAATFKNISTQTASLMSCKQSISCENTWGAGLSFSQAQAMKAAASAVVKVSLPNDHTIVGQTYGIFLRGHCTGIVVKNTLDASNYIVTAGHCLYDGGLQYYPNVSGSYRYAGIPAYVTFFLEKTACGAPLDLPSLGFLTMPAMVVGSQYTTNSYSGVGINGTTTDFAILKLAGELPYGVTPVTVAARPLSVSDNLFTFSHPFGLDKVGGPIDRGATYQSITPFQYVVSASKRITEPGSSGGPLFAYNAEKNSVALLGVLSGGNNVDDSPATICPVPQKMFYARLDGHAPFLKQYLGTLENQ